MATALVTQIAYAVQTLFDPAGTAGRLVDLGKLANYGLLTSFTPAALFTTGVNGAWHDPSDFSTMFQNAAGTVPVTAVEQPVGLMLDKSKGLVLGPELIPVLDFADWVNAGLLSSKTTNSFTTSGNGGVSKFIGSGKTYRIRIVGTTTGSLNVRNSGTVDGQTTIPAGSFDTTIIAPACFSTSSSLYFQLTTAGTVTITSMSVRELPGNHAYNSSGNSANFPVLSARYNLLTKTEQFDDAVWTKLIGGTGTQPVVTQNSATAPNGSITAAVVSFDIGSGTTLSDLSVLEQGVSVVSGTQYRGAIYVKAATPGDVGKSILMRHAAAAAGTIITLTASWQRVSSTENAFGTGTTAFRIGLRGSVTSNSVSVAFWGADLRVTNDALSQPAYQRVNTATDYDTVGFKPYLSFNGTNQWLQTNSIDFSYGDKMFVSAGVRKLSDANRALAVELGNAAASGAFFVSAPTSALNDYAFSSSGTTLTTAAASPYSSPITNIVSGIGSISASSFATLRVNGTQVAQNTATQGTGNYGNYPLYIGARAGTSLWFNGRLYGLVVAGKAASDSEIASTEAWLNQKTGAY